MCYMNNWYMGLKAVCRVELRNGDFFRLFKVAVAAILDF